jgi:predicted transcriptional regulator
MEKIEIVLSEKDRKLLEGIVESLEALAECVDRKRNHFNAKVGH